MEKLLFKFGLLMVAGIMITGLAGCGGSGSSAAAGAATAAKPAFWANVTVRAMDGAVNLQWDNTAGSAPNSQYNIYCSNSQSVNKQDPAKLIAAGVNGRSFDHTGLQNGTRYYYVITEVSATGEGPESSVVSATPQATLLTVPYGLKVTALNSGVQLDFAGPAPSDTTAVSYNIYRSTTPNNFTKIKTGIQLDALTKNFKPADNTDNSLANGTTYYYTVTAVAGLKESGFSPVVAATPQAPVAAVTYDDTTATVTAAAFASPTGMWAQAQNGSAIVG